MKAMLRMLTFALGGLAGASLMAAPHVHGEGQLDVAMEADGAVTMLLSLPGDTTVGFEHAPRDAQQREQIATARTLLGDSARWLRLPAAAGCSSDALSVTVPVVDGDDDHQHHDEHGHHDKHGHEDDAHDEHDHAAHSENWLTELQARCKPEALTHIDLSPLFAAFPSLQTLRVQYIGTHGQGGAELSAGNSVFELP